MPRRHPGVTKYKIKDGRIRWQYIIDNGHDHATGKRRQRRKRGFTTQADALAALKQDRAAIEAGGAYLDAEKLTFLQYMDLWLEGLAQTKLKERTLTDYVNETRRYIHSHMQDVRLHKLSPLHLEALYRTLTEGGGKNGKPLAAKTVLRVHRVIRKALGDAERKGLINSNPARLADKPSTAQDDNERPAWTPAQLRAFLDAAAGEQLYPLFRLAALSGMRRGELCGLMWEDVNFSAQTVRVRQTLAMINGKPKVESPKSRRSRRVLDLDDETADTLRAHRESQAELREFIGTSWTETGYVFTNPTGRPHHPDNVSRAFTGFVRTLDVPYLTLHGLRHTHATQLLAAGTNPRIVSERLGHANVAFTLQVYGHVLPGQQRQAAEAAAALLG